MLDGMNDVRGGGTVAATFSQCNMCLVSYTDCNLCPTGKGLSCESGCGACTQVTYCACTEEYKSTSPQCIKPTNTCPTTKLNDILCNQPRTDPVW